jgi:hypothetical protein
MVNWSLDKRVEQIKNDTSSLRQCRNGQMYARIEPDGEAINCCTLRKPLGNIIKGTFRLLDEPQACTAKDCICWRRMIIGEEERWSNSWGRSPQETLANK